MRLAILQCPSPDGDLEHAFHTISRAVRAAGAAGADVLVTPEVLLPGYNHPHIADRALNLSDPIFTRFADLVKSAGTGLVLGFAEKSDGHIWNSAVYIDPRGRTQPVYRKIQLYGPREKSIYTPGDHYVTLDLNGTKAAILICYDVEFSGHLTELAKTDVDIVLVPTANMQPFTHVVRHTVPALAANHALTIAYANFCGQDHDLTYVGGSLIAGPHGEVLAQAGEGPALLIADIPTKDPARLSTQSLDWRPATHA